MRKPFYTVIYTWFLSENFFLLSESGWLTKLWGILTWGFVALSFRFLSFRFFGELKLEHNAYALYPSIHSAKFSRMLKNTDISDLKNWKIFSPNFAENGAKCESVRIWPMLSKYAIISVLCSIFAWYSVDMANLGII